jgi:two-component system sensor histidine kinase FlrB
MNREALESAFDAFNQQSSRLEASYRGLQDQVALLSAQLAAAERAELQQLLEKERLGNRLARLLETLPAAVIVIDGEGIIRECNKLAEELLNTPLLGCAWSVIVQREFCRGASLDGELKLNDGRWLNLSRRSLDSEPGDILLLADITESRRTAELLQRSERLSGIGEMTAQLGHQIRTPLASALLYASQLDEAGTPEQKEVAGNIARRLRDLGSIVDDMLNYASGAKKNGEYINVSELLHDVAESIAPQLKKGSQLRIEIVDSSLNIIGNRDALKGALLNLVCNAGQACEDQPIIELCGLRSGDRVCLTVTDNGKGISEDIRFRLFEPFFTTRPQGTGLGLAVVRSVAEAHAGEVLLECGPQGTAFSLCLPAPDDRVVTRQALLPAERIDD